MKSQGTREEIESIRNEVEKCIRCGSCLFYCPVYSEIADENYGPRGRNHLIKGLVENPQDLVTDARDRFEKCLLCGGCTNTCPQGVRNDLIMLAVRGELVRQNGLPLTSSLAFRHVLKNRDTMKKALRMAAAFQWMLPESKRKGGSSGTGVSSESGRVRHIPMLFTGIAGTRHFPSIAASFLSERISEINPPDPNSDKKDLRVAYFSGCATEFMFPHVGESLIRLLQRSGVEVIFPKNQGCCGTAVHANGDMETAREMALHNMQVLSEAKADYVVTGCATCGSALKEGWASLVQDRGPKALVSQFAAKVRDISEFIVEMTDLKPLRYQSLLPDNVRVTYHDPCHLARHQRVVEQPRAILQKVFGNRFVEMDNNGCCGFGGSFNLKNQDLSRKIGQDKIESIKRTKADVVITTCPGCMIHLIDGIEQNHMSQRVMHLASAVEPS
ncbi:(Fe-S)-binding protein [Desulfomonile tiedjei]|uniref:Glycolate oxidase iron-sulfur subunit n=1 Tax=Desulfomonile tiedjei (strain ATCC 49306 / DSM 6799 / DCB-1) TaxID=706587 RepID=I4C8J2_DESTA|nr:(Fe-S)-binding protein [Desulfomonile tiedjei]AFM25883.1 Fe-S oxidoreductase [Desulfomonile tiedjei DSM 6799]